MQIGLTKTKKCWRTSRPLHLHSTPPRAINATRSTQSRGQKVDGSFIVASPSDASEPRAVQHRSRIQLTLVMKYEVEIKGARVHVELDRRSERVRAVVDNREYD